MLQSLKHKRLFTYTTSDGVADTVNVRILTTASAATSGGGLTEMGKYCQMKAILCFFPGWSSQSVLKDR